MNKATLRYEELIRGSKAWLEYARELGLAFVPSMREDESPAVAEDPGCRECPLREERQGLYEWPGEKRPQIVFVSAMPPPPMEEGEYSPFTGEAGRQLEKIMEATGAEAGLGISDIALTFAVKCIMPPHRGTEPQVLERAYRACAKLLRGEILEFAPSVVIAMGAEAARALTGLSDLKAARGRLHEFSGEAGPVGIQVMPTYGLKELLVQKSLKRPVWDDIQLAIKALKN
ncbi:MAG: uracil-DNA glycosylase family protein [Thermodesulfobacteriota bacterium]